jgi:hypothetical protein
MDRLSVTAGVCEGPVFQGYLQRQFIALTENMPAGILLSAAAFGAAHAYQGLPDGDSDRAVRRHVWDSANWRGTIRPGIIAQTSHNRKALLTPDSVVIDNLNKHYVDLEVARKTTYALLAHEKNSDDDRVTDGGAFAELLIKQLREVSHDMH